MPTESPVSKVKQLYESLVGSRGTTNGHWQEAAKFGSPRDRIFQEYYTPGSKVRQQQYDEYAELTLDRASAMFVSMTSPKHQRYFGLTTLSDPWENKIDQETLDRVTDILFDARYRPKAGFSEARSLYAHSLLGFGNGCVFADVGPNIQTPIRYRFCHLANTHFIVDGLDEVVGAFESRKLSALQILQEFGEENVSDTIKEKAARDGEGQNQESGGEYTVVHCVKLNEDHNPHAEIITNDNMRFKSQHFINELPDDGFLREGGYNTMPYAITRDDHIPGEIYGRGTLQKILHTIKMINSIKRDHIAAGHNIAHPALLMRDDSSFNASHLKPNSMVRGGLDSNGNPTVVPLNKGNRFDVSEAMLKETRDIIDRAFNMDLLISNVSETRDRVTATEILTRSQELARTAGPLAARDEDQFQNTLVERELDILIGWGLIDDFDTSDEFSASVFFKSQMSFAQRADDVIAANRVVEGLQIASQFDPTVRHKMDWSSYADLLASANGAPANILKSEEEFLQAVQSEQEQQQAESIMSNASGLAQGIEALGGSPDAGAI